MKHDITPILKLDRATKKFAGVTAVDHVHFNLYPGEVHALLGENGAGKSTLIKMLSGIHKLDEGQMEYKGQNLQWSGPAEARKNGICVIHQELSLCPNITVAENIFLGQKLPQKYGFVNWNQLYSQAQAIIDYMGIELNPREKVSKLSVAQQQMVEIARSLSFHSKVLIMDEPTAVLTNKETDKLFKIISELRKNGVAIVYISHRMEEIFEISNRCTVMRDGRWIDTVFTHDITSDDLIKMMVGRELKDLYSYEHKRVAVGKQPTLEVKDLRDVSNKIKDVSFELYPGEIVGISGLVGAGRTELARAIFGRDPLLAGEVLINGEKVTIQSPSDAIQYGIAYVPENRKEEGLFLDLSVNENIMFTQYKQYRKYGFLQSKTIDAEGRGFIDQLSVKTSSPKEKITHLSGGNQQKALIARWLSVKPRILLLDEPTRGVDIGAKKEIYDIIQGLAEQGISVFMISSELPEVLGISDRILVMHEGKLVANLAKEEANQENVMYYATGGSI